MDRLATSADESESGESKQADSTGLWNRGQEFGRSQRGVTDAELIHDAGEILVVVAIVATETEISGATEEGAESSDVWIGVGVEESSIEVSANFASRTIIDKGNGVEVSIGLGSRNIDG